MTVITAANTPPYHVTSSDVLWLHRAVQAEGEPCDRVAAALVNGFMLSRSRGYRSSLGTYVRAYSQPVNPRWFEHGDLFMASYAKANTDAVKTARINAARTREHVHSLRTDFTEVTRQAVARALREPPELAQATDFAASWVKKPETWRALTPAEKNRNRFWARPGSESWAGYGAAASAGALLFFVALGLAWWLRGAS